MPNKIDLGNGIELYFEDYGKGDAILFIPGLTCTTEFFEHNLETLSDRNRIICYDPRSQGNSTITEIGNNFAQRGRDLAAFIDVLDLNNIVIAGWSLGAYDAYSYFRQFGLDKVKAFINIDMCPKTIQIDDDDWAEIYGNQISRSCTTWREKRANAKQTTEQRNKEIKEKQKK
ncbi:MAG: alpha/beta hydrolase, partial [Gammaproteobacteria bacterium]|nr:alpha/beta hydrolase [Gammaproteobacteria bacterium]